MSDTDTREPEPPTSTRNIQTLLTGVAALLVAGLVAFFLLRPADTFVPMAMTHNMPTIRCRPVPQGDIAALEKDPRWQHVVRSMHWHMQVNQLESISAFHMGEPTCFLLVRLGDNHTILSMFNTVFRGYSPAAIASRNEESLACPGVIRNMLRAMHVRVSYVDGATHEEMVELFSGAEAFALQHVNFYSLGKTICDLHASNADKGIATLRELLVADTSL